MARRPHVMVVAPPAQGHVRPLLKLSHQIASQGIKVTFVNTEIIHAKVVAAMSDSKNEEIGGVTLVSVPDGVGQEDDRKDIFKFTECFQRTMPGNLKDLIQRTNDSNEDEPIRFVLVGATIGWLLDVVQDLGIKQAAFWTGSPAGLAFFCHVPKLIEDGVLDMNGNIVANDQASISEEIPAWNCSELPWHFPGEQKLQKLFFDMGLVIRPTAQHVKWILCNASYELHSQACDLVPNILPVGPFLTTTENSASTGSFWLEDTSCLSWLDGQEAGSVVYVAFGSIAVFSQQQFDEIALGLELSGQPFLWVVRSDLANGSPVAYPDGFLERVADRGKIVEWAPQENVLAHPSIAVFLTHCGWNSTMEGASLGVPFLCWPYFADQFYNQKYICDIWKVGLKVNPGEDGIRSRTEISTKIQQGICDDNIRINASKLKDLCQKCLSKGGSSFENFKKFIDHLRS
ncbi:UDP-glycosyltransferase 83A1-like [Coffea eugenioides]|uniref:UDP-glycosyltransferase 83A1-like n=1 Tax=Coffea eugenioides TaxID=49369 RepID=UPI000F6122ED|nr:UDP-glycosyltransferase 83A1-like [Coffea eugenioides]XP_027168550.1 UDP-glycosyltransferase 83A1-like [Coffea eugenioides]